MDYTLAKTLGRVEDCRYDIRVDNSSKTRLIITTPKPYTITRSEVKEMLDNAAIADFDDNTPWSAEPFYDWTVYIPPYGSRIEIGNRPSIDIPKTHEKFAYTLSDLIRLNIICLSETILFLAKLSRHDSSNQT